MTTSTAAKPLTIDLPGKFDVYFSGSGVAQGQTENDPTLEKLHAAYKAAVVIRRGKGRAIRLTLPDEGATDILVALIDYADTCYVVNSDLASDRTVEARDRFDALGEQQAAMRVIERARKLLDQLKG
jgi:hypothetical protein